MMTGSPLLAWRANRRAGFTIAECTIALAVLAACSLLVGELAIWMLAQRTKIEARFEAEQIATNVLEQARAFPWEELTPAWAAERKLPQGALDRWPQTKLLVRVEVEPDHPRVKRVTAEVRLEADTLAKGPTFRMVALFTARGKEGSP